MNKKIKITLLLTLVFTVFFCTNVYAETGDEYVTEITKTTCEEDAKNSGGKFTKEDCIKTAKKCITALYPAVFNLKVDIIGTSQFKISLTNSSKKPLNKKYKFRLNYVVKQGEKEILNKTEEVEVDVSSEKKDENGNAYYDPGYIAYVPSGWDENNNTSIEVNALLVSELKNTLEIGNTKEELDCTRRFTATAEAEIPANPKKEKIENPDYIDNANGLCNKYVSGGLKESDISSSLSKTLKNNYNKLIPGGAYSYEKIKNYTTTIGSGEEVFKDTAAYCYAKSVDVKLRKTDVLKIIYNAAKGIDDTKTTGGPAIDKEFPYLDPNVWKKIDDTSKSLSLTCDAFGEYNAINNSYSSTNNVRHFYHKYDAKTVNANYHYTVNGKDEAGVPTNHPEICNIECLETLTITYGPPVAVKAGFCFEYEVKVESKVYCKGNINKNAAPKIENYQICEPSPYCGHAGTAWENQAGPNEEFDSCIQTKYNGKYTQKAVNACYNEVYKKSNKTNNKKINLALNYSPVMKMSNAETISKLCNMAEYGNQDVATNSGDFNESDPDNLLAAYNSEGYFGGYYSDTSGTFKWYPYYGNENEVDTEGIPIPTLGKCYWNQYARFYFNSIGLARRTVGNDGHIVKHWGSNYLPYQDSLSKWKYYPAPDGNKVAGIKIGYAYGNKCTDVCKYLTESCENRYYNYVAPSYAVAPNGNTKNYQLSALDSYYRDLEDYQKKLAECTAAAKCDTNEATYIMTVNGLTSETDICEKEEDGKCSYWTETKHKNQCEYNTDNLTLNGVTTQLTVKDANTFGVEKSALSSCKNIAQSQGTAGGESIIREISGVCANVPGDGQDYRTIISFPGSWIDTKKFKWKYHEPKEKTKYIKVPGKYCVGTTVNSVNLDWWKWDQELLRTRDLSSVKYKVTKDSADKEVKVLSEGKYNIKAIIKTFGASSWNFNIQCFYSVEGPDTTCNKKCCNGTCKEPLDNETKPISLDDMFPSTEVNTVQQSNEAIKEVTPTKLNNITTENNTETNNVMKVENTTTANREVGYNWTCEATNLLIPDYPVTPTALIAKIQSDGNKVYSKPEELDYEIVLTRQNIKDIREDNKSREETYGDAYLTVGDNYYENKSNFINFYKSEFLQSKMVTLKQSPNVHTCNNMKNGECDTYSYKNYKDSCSKLGE